MFINFCSSEAGHFKLLKEALGSFQEKETDFKLVGNGGHSLKIPKCFKLFSHFLSDIIDSCPPFHEVPTIILPDCPVNSIQHLTNLLIKGSTESQENDHDVVKDIIEVANVLNIYMKNLVYEEQTKHYNETMKVDELEEGEIEDDEEDILLRSQQEKQIFEKDSGIQIASFAKVDSSNPNIMSTGKINNNILFQCTDCKKSFGSEAAFDTHLKITSKHGNKEDNLLCLWHKYRNYDYVEIENDEEGDIGDTRIKKPCVAKVESFNPLPFKCPECEKYFGTKPGLRRHQKKNHYKEKEKQLMRCSVCYQVMESKKLHRHMAIHKTCEVCGEVFDTIRSMVGHSKTVHGCKPYKCNSCEYAVSNKNNLKKHMKKQHDIDSDVKLYQ